jgi:hypothetical protein
LKDHFSFFLRTDWGVGGKWEAASHVTVHEMTP